MNHIFLSLAFISGVAAFFEFNIHKDHSRKYPDAPCHSATLGFVIICVVCVISLINGVMQ